MHTTRRVPYVGVYAWHVDWCASIPVDDYGDGDLDNADYRTEIYWSKSRAEDRAREVLPDDAFGSVSITPVEFTAYDDDDAKRYPHIGFWEPTAEPEEFS